MGENRCSAKNLPTSFFKELSSPDQLLALLNHLPATYFFAKDLDGQFVHVNRALIDVLGMHDESDVLGKTDHDLFPPEIADQYRAHDREVHESGSALINHVCSIPDSSGVLRWYVETKIPLTNSDGETIGVAGVMYDLEKAGAMLQPYERLNAAITHITNRYAEKITLEKLAQLSHLSVSQFKRVFQQLFRITPTQYLGRVRINAACVLLRETTLNMEAVAERTGFFDASHFVKQFRAQMNQTPGEFRQRTSSAILRS